MSVIRTWVITTWLVVGLAQAFYLPGVAPTNYAPNEEVPILVNKLDSVVTQLPYDYYSLPFCPPAEGEVVRSAENLGEYLLGDRIENSPYTVGMNSKAECQILCRQQLTQDLVKKFTKKIEQNYRVHMIADNLPAFTKTVYEAGGELFDRYDKGYALGQVGGTGCDGKICINNHIVLKLHYHEVSAEEFRVVGFEIEGHSVRHKYDSWNEETPTESKLTSCPVLANSELQSLDPDKTDLQEIVFTYDVNWQSSEVKWASRWDIYLKMTDAQIHWFSIMNSLMIVVFLSIMVAMIIIRTLRRDLARYNLDDSEESQQEDTGWKLVHGDVFRPPQHGGLLATLVGSGAQVFGMGLATMVFACLGFLSPANRGGLMSAMLLMFVFMGLFAGYYGTRVFLMLGLQSWRKNTLFTALFFPGINFAVFFFLNLFVWAKGSSGAIPFFEMFALLVLWFGISVPLVYLGSYIAYKRPAVKAPVKVNQIPRLIPEQPWYMKAPFSILVGGVLPFGAVFIEVFFIMTSLWLHRFYYVFGFLFLVFIILIVTCAEITIVMCYFQLCSGDHKWWWRSFLTSGSSALYLFLYSFLYFFTNLDITNFFSGLLYFGYMSLICFFFFVLTGSIGFLATLLFVRKIYGEVKLE